MKVYGKSIGEKKDVRKRKMKGEKGNKKEESQRRKIFFIKNKKVQ
jgi:hypothetical protein